MLIITDNKTIDKKPEIIKPQKELLVFEEGTLTDYYDLSEEKAEYLSEGMIVMNSPASFQHETIFCNLLILLGNYCKKNNMGNVLGSRFTIILGENRFEPDIVFISKNNKGNWTEYEFKGIPELVIEIVSKTTHDYDLIKKRNIYKEYKINELWFVDYTNNKVIVDKLTNDKYETINYNFKEKVKSSIFPELEIIIE